MRVVRNGIVTGLMLAGAFGTMQEARAQAGGARAVAFVNARSVLQTMPGYTQAESTFVRELEEGRAEIGRLQAGLDSAVAEYEQQQAMLTPTNRQTRRRELEGRNQQLLERQEEFQNRMARRERELLQPMQERLTAVIEGVRAEGNYAMILDLGAQTGIVTYDRTLDLTQRVIERIRQGN